MCIVTSLLRGKGLGFKREQKKGLSVRCDHSPKGKGFWFMAAEKGLRVRCNQSPKGKGLGF